MSELLSPPELHQLTGFARACKQGDWLKAQGIPHRTDGPRVIASREHVRAWKIRQNPPSNFDWKSCVLVNGLPLIQVGDCSRPSICGIYALFTKNAGLLYIGKSVDIQGRITAHTYGRKHRFTQYCEVEVPPEYLGQMEIAHIEALMPPGNGLFETRWPDTRLDRKEIVQYVRDAWGVIHHDLDATE